MFNTTQFEFIKAEPGWLVLQPFYDRSVIIRIYKEPVISWKIEHIIGSTADRTTVMIFPVTPSGVHEEFVLQTPDGFLYVPDEEDFKDENDVINYFEGLDQKRELRQQRLDEEKDAALKIDD